MSAVSSGMLCCVAPATQTNIPEDQNSKHQQCGNLSASFTSVTAISSYLYFKTVSNT
jgi:hypothetical protein